MFLEQEADGTVFTTHEDDYAIVWEDGTYTYPFYDADDARAFADESDWQGEYKIVRIRIEEV